jgi:ABC-type siderophore export system fused ATPase/permease subunit
VKKGVYVEGLKECEVSSVSDIMVLLLQVTLLHVVMILCTSAYLFYFSCTYNFCFSSWVVS